MTTPPPPAHPDESDTQSLLKRTATFKAPGHSFQTDNGSVLTKLIGTKAAPSNRVSESLDYEPIQNRVYQDRLRTKKDGKKKLYGCVGLWACTAFKCHGMRRSDGPTLPVYAGTLAIRLPSSSSRWPLALRLAYLP